VLAGGVVISRFHKLIRLPNMTQNKLRLYDYAASCNCYKVRLLFAQLGLAYERVAVDIFNGETLTDEYVRMRTTPVLQTSDGRHLPESNAILVYLAHGSAYLPDDPFERAQTVRWLIYEQTDVVPMIGGLRFRLLAGRLKPSDPDAIRRREGAAAVLSLLDEHLRANDFFVGGRYTIADIAIYGYTHRAHEAGLEIEPYSSVTSWLKRVEQQPGYVEDVQPYGANAAPRAGRSVYD
jgi:glutathione S-transferase